MALEYAQLKTLHSLLWIRAMQLKLSEGLNESGVVVGNTFDKYSSSNLLVRSMMGGFHSALDDFVAKVSPATIHEVGCGEGYWTLRWQAMGYSVRGCDFSESVIDLAKENAGLVGAPEDIFRQRSIYDLSRPDDGADLIVCCEVLEHLEDPERALDVLRSILDGYLIISVPREPVWRALNFMRLKYVMDLGNTPGHLQHWSSRGFLRLLSRYFEVVAVRQPLPWTMALCRSR
jgi:2-polyprenyl-3-methyl-5-hydroxy-6-metoxy-1,4-benzoquinol methylase